MTRLPVFALAATLIAGAAAADRMVIDDDAWFMTDDRPETGQVIDVDDDGWKRVNNVAERSDRTASTPGNCTQLEMSAGISGEACGVLSRAEVMRRIGAAN
ncbi:MAG: hypothetical protein AAF919_15090 [Pseudomonadota bacterium]